MKRKRICLLMVLVLVIGILSESAQGVYAQTTAQGQAVTAEQVATENPAVAGKQPEGYCIRMNIGAVSILFAPLMVP